MSKDSNKNKLSKDWKAGAFFERYSIVGNLQGYNELFNTAFDSIKNDPLVPSGTKLLKRRSQNDELPITLGELTLVKINPEGRQHLSREMVTKLQNRYRQSNQRFEEISGFINNLEFSPRATILHRAYLGKMIDASLIITSDNIHKFDPIRRPNDDFYVLNTIRSNRDNPAQHYLTTSIAKVEGEPLPNAPAIAYKGDVMLIGGKLLRAGAVNPID